MAPKPKTKTRADTYGHGTIEQRNGRWRATLTVSRTGEPRRRLSATFDRERDAKSWLVLKQADRLRGVVSPKRVTTAEYLDEWLDGPYCAPLSSATRRQYAKIVRVYLKPQLGRVHLVDLTPARIGQALLELSREPSTVAKSGVLSPRTLGICKATLSSALRRAVENGLLAVNPAVAAPLPHRGSSTGPKHRALTDEELAAVLRAIDRDSPRVGPLVVFALSTGLRLGELLGVDLDDIDAEARTVRVRSTLAIGDDGRYRLRAGAKTAGSLRTVPLGEVARAALRDESRYRAAERLRAGAAWHGATVVFATSIGTPTSPRTALRSWHLLCDAAEIDRRPFHHLRHSYATELLSGGLELERVSKLLGHSAIALTSSTYADVRDRLTATSAAMLDDAFSRARAK